jgi:hypothetical protein
MNATIKNMELIHADNLTPDQLMPDDLIEIEDGIVTVIDLESDAMGDKYFISYENEFGEKDVTEIPFDSKIKLFVFVEEL